MYESMNQVCHPQAQTAHDISIIRNTHWIEYCLRGVPFQEVRKADDALNYCYPELLHVGIEKIIMFMIKAGGLHRQLSRSGQTQYAITLGTDMTPLAS